MATVDEMFTTQTVLNYIRQRQPQVYLGDTLFPERKVDDIEFDMIKGANNLPVAAQVHAFDSKTQLANRDGAKKSVEELALIKRQIRMDEKTIIRVNTPRTNAEQQQAINTIYDDIDNMVNAVKARVEAMRMEVLSSGKLAINENGVKANLDYGTPSNHQTSTDWTASTATPLDDIYNWADKIVNDTGITPTRALTTKPVLNLLLKNTSIRKAALGTESDKILTVTGLNQLLSSLDLPTVESYDLKYRIQKSSGKGYISKRYLDDTKFVLMPEDMIGETIYGLTAEEIELRSKSDVQISSIGNILAEIYSTVDPVARYTKAVATALPSFPAADECFMATVRSDS